MAQGTSPLTTDYSEGDVVEYTTQDNQQDSARVRRVYADALQLVNRARGYQYIERRRVGAIIGEVIPMTYLCRPKAAEGQQQMQEPLL